MKASCPWPAHAALRCHSGGRSQSRIDSGMSSGALGSRISAGHRSFTTPSGVAAGCASARTGSPNGSSRGRRGHRCQCDRGIAPATACRPCRQGSGGSHRYPSSGHRRRCRGLRSWASWGCSGSSTAPHLRPGVVERVPLAATGVPVSDVGGAEFWSPAAARQRRPSSAPPRQPPSPSAIAAAMPESEPVASG